MKQILYIPSGSYFLWYNVIPGSCVIPTLSAEEVLNNDSEFFKAKNVTDVETLLNSIVENPHQYNLTLYKRAGIDFKETLDISEFEIIEDGK
jgi:hypothetical protein